MQISSNRNPENQKAVGGFRKYLAGKGCVHSELSPHDPGKINLCGGKTKSGPGQDTSFLEHKALQPPPWEGGFKGGSGGC